LPENGLEVLQSLPIASFHADALLNQTVAEFRRRKLALRFVQGVHCCNPAIASGNHVPEKRFQTFKCLDRAQARSCGTSGSKPGFACEQIAHVFNAFSLFQLSIVTAATKYFFMFDK
jgi:hypothetical protein